MTFGEEILNFRAKHNLTQIKMADIIGVAPNSIHRYECEKYLPSKMKKIQIENKMKEWEEKKNVSL